jgi:hypothetical protein
MSRTALSLSLLAALASPACAGSPQEDPGDALTRVAAAPAGELTVELLTEGPRLETGLNPVYLKITTPSGQVVADADVTLSPEMAMSGGPTHGAPVIGAPAPGSDGVYRVEVVFQMATSMMGSWSATVGVTRPASAPVEASFPALAVADSGCAKTFTHFDPDDAVTSKYVASLDFRAAPRVGLNPVVATLHRMEDMMTFVPVTDATMALDPQMTSMGHGSPGSVDPTPTTLGRYEGQLSFSMAGTWETTVTISQDGATLGAPKFTTTF